MVKLDPGSEILCGSDFVQRVCDLLHKKFKEAAAAAVELELSIAARPSHRSYCDIRWQRHVIESYDSVAPVYIGNVYTTTSWVVAPPRWPVVSRLFIEKKKSLRRRREFDERCIRVSNYRPRLTFVTCAFRWRGWMNIRFL